MLKSLDAVAIFIEVVNQGSFILAAKKLGLPPSTVSDRISQLEANLGISLLTRTTRSLKLTQAGQDFFNKSAPAVKQLNDAADAAEAQQGHPTGTLRISTPLGFAEKELAQAVAKYRERHNNMSVEIFFSNDAVDLVKGDFDIAIRGGKLSDSSLRGKKFGLGTLKILASPAFAKGIGKIKHPSDLRETTAIRFQGSPTSRTYDDWHLLKSDGSKMQRYTLKPNYKMTTNSFPALIELLIEGQGIGFAGGAEAITPLRKGNLVQILPGWTSEVFPGHILYAANRIQVPKIRAMVPLLEEALKSLFA